MNPLLKKQYDGPGGVGEMMAIALPMIISCACDTVMTFTDRLFLARLGSEQMSAAMGGGLTCFMLTTFFFGLTGYCTPLVAQYLGAGRKEYCAVAATQGLIISLLAWPIILMLRPAGHWLFEVIHVPASQIAPQKAYFDILLYGTLFSLLRNTLSSFFSGIGKTRIVMLSAITAMLVNVILNYILIYGKLGCPPLGIRGAAYGTIIGGVCGLAVLGWAYLNQENRRQYGVGRSLRFDKQIMGKLLRFGYPSGVEMFLNLLAFDLMVLIFHSCGDATAAAITIVFNWDMVSFIPLIGVHIGVMSLVGRYMGAGSPDTAHRAAMSGLKLAWLYSFCTFITFAVFTKSLVGVFRPNDGDVLFAEVFPTAVFMLRIAAFYVMADATMLVFGGALRGAGDTFWAMCISVAMHWTLVVILTLFLKIFHFTPTASWIMLCSAFLSFSAVFYLRYRGGKWRSIRVVDTDVALPPTNGFHETKDL